MHIPEYRDPAQIYLSPQEQRVFDKFRRTDEAALTAEEYHLLVSQFLVEPYPAVDDRPDRFSVTISAQGRALRAYQKERRRAKIKSTCAFLITMLIALATLAATVWPTLSGKRTSRNQDQLPKQTPTAVAQSPSVSTALPAASPTATPEPPAQDSEPEQLPVPVQELPEEAE